MSASDRTQTGIADAAIVGGGIIGLTIAEELARRGKRVVLIDRRGPGGEASWAAGGMLAADYEFDGPSPLATLAFASRALWPALLTRLAAAPLPSAPPSASTPPLASTPTFPTQAQLASTPPLPAGGGRGEGAAPGTLLPAMTGVALAELEKRFAWHRSPTSGRRVEILDPARARAIEPALPAGIAGAIWLPDDIAVDNRAVLLALVAALRAYGEDAVRIVRGEAELLVEDGRACGVVLGNGNGIGIGIGIGNGERIPAKVVIDAAGVWAGSLKTAGGSRRALPPAPSRWEGEVAGEAGTGGGVSPQGDRVALPVISPVLGQMVQFTAERADALRAIVRWENGYAIPRGDGRIVVGATVEPQTGFGKANTPAGIAMLTAGFRAALPSLAGLPCTHVWAGLRPATADELPILGPHATLPGLLLACGHYRNGILLAPATAVAIADLVEGKAPSPGLAIDTFAASRPSLHAQAITQAITVNGKPRALPSPPTVGALLDALSQRRNGVAVALNEEVVRRGDWDTTALRDRDRVEIIHAVGGG